MSEKQDAISVWWSAFQSKRNDISAFFHRDQSWDLEQWMSANLQAIHPHLMWEFGPAVHGAGHRLVITPESRHELRPLVTAIIQAAPQIDGWEFYAYRQPESVEMMLQTVEARTGGDLSQASFRTAFDDLQRITIQICAPHFSEQDENSMQQAFVTMESLVGEEVLNRWIGYIIASPTSTEEADQFEPLERMKPVVDQLIEELQSALPDRPLFEMIGADGEDSENYVYELEPEQAEDYTERGDLAVARTAYRTMWMAAHSPIMFDSARYSNCGETFCYVKVDGSGEDIAACKFADKAEIEDALDAALRAAGLGCTIGGGTGLRYSYIDLAIIRLPEAAAVIAQTLRDGLVPRRTWLHFFDTDLQGRWIGIWDDAEAPPISAFEEEAEE